MEIFDIKKIIKNQATFFKYRKGFLYYIIDYEGKDYMFPIPIDDLGDATVEATGKGITYMRYINQAIKDSTFVSPY